jgi:hypothetical protein
LTAGSAKNNGSATGSSGANAGDQVNAINQNAPCADNGVAFSGTNNGANVVGNGNKTNVSSGTVYGVVLQGNGQGSLLDGLGVPGLAGGRGNGSSSISVQNAVNNLGNVNAQGAQNQGGSRKGSGSSPNQNSTQTFIGSPQ